MNRVRSAIRHALREPVSRRALAELGYVLLSVPVTVLGLLYTVLSFVLGVGLAITAIGVPLTGFAVHSARRLGALRRRMARRLLRNLSTQVDSHGVVHQGFIFDGVVYDTWYLQLLVCLAGAALLLLAPWAVRALLLVDRLLIRSLLGPGGSAERIRDLERSRAYAIDDVAATLRRIERDLHDGAQARMVAVAMSLTMLNETLGPDVDRESRRLLDAARDHARDALVELREVVGNIHPPALDGGLATALSTLATRSPIPVNLHAELPARPAAAIETIAYFSAAELLTNVTKHSGASHIAVDIVVVSNRLRLSVTDDGHGGAHVNGGTGLRGLTERVGTVDGRLAVDSPPGGPTVVTVDLPLHT